MCKIPEIILFGDMCRKWKMFIKPGESDCKIKSQEVVYLGTG